MTAELPPSWVDRLRRIIVAEELPIAWIQGKRGDGGERLLNHWSEQGMAIPLRPGDLQDEDAFRIASEEGRQSSDRSPIWFVAKLLPESVLQLNAARSSTALPDVGRPNVGKPNLATYNHWGEWMLPGERLIIYSERLGSTHSLGGPTDSSSRLHAHPSGTTAGILHVPGQALRLLESEVRELCALRSVEEPSSSTSWRQRLRKCQGNLLALERAILETSNSSVEEPIRKTRGERKTRLAIELLGWPRIRARAEISGEAETTSLDWGYQSVLELLAALATASERQLGRDELLDRLWPDLENEDARKHLYPTVSHLRKLLSGHSPGRSIELNKAVYRLEVGSSWSIDVDGLEDAVNATGKVEDDLLAVIGRSLPEPEQPDASVQKTIGILRAGWQLVRGDFLQGFEGEWVRAKRAEVRLSHQLILRRLACQLFRSGRVKDVEEVLRSLLIQDRAQEDAHLTMMRVYAQRGRVDLARRQYERMCQALHEELGMQPMDNTVREVERILVTSAR